MKNKDDATKKKKEREYTRKDQSNNKKSTSDRDNVRYDIKGGTRERREGYAVRWTFETISWCRIINKNNTKIQCYNVSLPNKNVMFISKTCFV